MHPDKLLDGVEIIKRQGEVDFILGVTDNSREVEPDYLFVALKGEKEDGHNYLDEARANGAKFLVLEEEVSTPLPYILVPNTRRALAKIASNYYENPSASMTVIGVTGTNGKTTTAFLLSSIYQDSISFNTIRYKGPDREMKAINTTPSSLIIQRELRNALNKGIKTAIIEVSSHSVVQDRVSAIDFDYGVFTNLSRDHLDYHKTFEDYREAKSRFFEGLGEEKMALINVDDPNACYFIKNTLSRIVTYGMGKGNIRGKVLENSIDNLVVRIEGMEREIKVRSPLIGVHNAYNILAASSVAILDGIDDFRIIDGIESAEPPFGRMEKVLTPKPIWVIIDYAHTPEALNNAISSLRQLAKKRVITLFGAGGDRDKGKRAMMGMVASRLSDVVILTSDNPRSENPEAIIDDIMEGVDGKEIYRIPNRKEAIFKSLDIAEKSDVVLIAGKGHEEYQEIQGERTPFSDRECVEEYFKG